MSVKSDNSSMVSLNPKYKCKGCSKMLSVNSIMNHIVNKPDCLNQYSQNDLDEQKRLCKDHQNNKRRNKRISSNKEIYQRRKKQKNLEVYTSVILAKNFFGWYNHILNIAIIQRFLSNYIIILIFRDSIKVMVKHQNMINFQKNLKAMKKILKRLSYLGIF